MLLKHKRSIIPMCLCLSALFASLGCIPLNGAGGGNRLLPVRSLTLMIDESQREQLFDQLQKFADEHTFKFVLSEYEKTDHFLVEIWGDDILITASDDPGNSGLVSIFFSGKYPGYPVDLETVDEYLIDLKTYISEIPNVTITEEK